MDNEAGVRSGWNDSPLSETGLRQARELRALVADLEFDAVHASDLSRAVRTAELAFPGLAIQIDPRLREMNFGEWSGRAGASFRGQDHGHVETRYPSGESCRDVEARVKRFLDECYAPDRNIAIVGHRFTQLSLDVILGGNDWASAIDQDWRNTGKWQPGWKYDVDA